MCRTSLRTWIMAACLAAALLALPTTSRADCALTDWLFGHGQTSYAPAYAPPSVYVPPTAAGCGCAPVSPCQPCVPTTTMRISYRPVPTVAYMPVVSIDPCSGCPVTTYQPKRAWTYQASLDRFTPYRAAYAPTVPVAACSIYGCAPCSGYSSSYGGCSSCSSPCGGCSSYTGRSSCGSGVSGGCSSCGSGISGSYTSAGGCSSCGSTPAPISTMPLPGPASSVPTLAPSQPLLAPSSPATIGSPTTVPTYPPSSPEAPGRTYGPGAVNPPLSPSAPITSGSSSSTFYHAPATSEGSRSVEPARIQGVPALPNNGPQLSPPPVPHPTNDNLTTSRPVWQATYFQLLPSPPAKTPAQTISAPATARPIVDDGGWRHADD